MADLPLLCALGRHRARDLPRWNNGYYFSTCRRCGQDLVRTAFETWHVPRGFKVVWADKAMRPVLPAGTSSRLAPPSSQAADASSRSPAPAAERDAGPRRFEFPIRTPTAAEPEAPPAAAESAPRAPAGEQAAPIVSSGVFDWASPTRAGEPVPAPGAGAKELPIQAVLRTLWIDEEERVAHGRDERNGSEIFEERAAEDRAEETLRDEVVPDDDWLEEDETVGDFDEGGRQERGASTSVQPDGDPLVDESEAEPEPEPVPVPESDPEPQPAPEDEIASVAEEDEHGMDTAEPADEVEPVTSRYEVIPDFMEDNGDDAEDWPLVAGEIDPRPREVENRRRRATFLSERLRDQLRRTGAGAAAGGKALAIKVLPARGRAGAPSNEADDGWGARVVAGGAMAAVLLALAVAVIGDGRPERMANAAPKQQQTAAGQATAAAKPPGWSFVTAKPAAAPAASPAGGAQQVADSPAPGTEAFVTATILNCRAKPADDGETVRRLSRGAPVEILTREPPWLSIEHRGRQCWANSRYISDAKPL